MSKFLKEGRKKGVLTYEEKIAERGKSQCKGTEAQVCLACLRKNKKPCGAGSECASNKIVGDKVREIIGGQIVGDIVDNCNGFGF